MFIVPFAPSHPHPHPPTAQLGAAYLHFPLGWPHMSVLRRCVCHSTALAMRKMIQLDGGGQERVLHRNRSHRLFVGSGSQRRSSIKAIESLSRFRLFPMIDEQRSSRNATTCPALNTGQGWVMTAVNTPQNGTLHGHLTVHSGPLLFAVSCFHLIRPLILRRRTGTGGQGRRKGCHYSVSVMKMCWGTKESFPPPCG